MSRNICLLLIVFAAGLPGMWAGDSPAVFRSDVSLVRVDAQVLDGDNRAITGLRATDFILKEEGRPQPIRHFASEQMPLDVLLLLDVSASMRPHVQRIANAAHEAFRVLRQQDRVAIMVFDRYSRVRLAFRNNTQDAEREFEVLLHDESFRGGTDITRGLLDAAEYIQRNGRTDARRAIVILTDDQTELHRDVDSVSRALTRANAVLSLLLAPDAMQTGRHDPIGHHGDPWPGVAGGPLGGIILGRQRGPYGRRGPGSGWGGLHTQSAGTAEIARRSGGDTFPVDDAAALESTLARLRQRYALHFYLPAGVRAGEERSIEVQLTEAAQLRYPGAEVHYRRIYIAASGTGAAIPAEVTSAPVITSAGADPAASQSPKRRAVNQVPDNSREGPLVIDQQ